MIHRYLLSGLASYAVDLATFSALTALMPAGFAAWTVAGRIAGAATGYVLHERFSFAGPKALGRRAMLARHVAVLAANAGGSALALWALVDRAGAPVAPARLVVDVVGIACVYLASRHLVFRRA